MDTLARGRYQAAAKKLLKAFSGRAQSYGGGCWPAVVLCLGIRSVAPEFCDTLWHCLATAGRWSQVPCHQSARAGLIQVTSLKFYSVGWSNNDIVRYSNHSKIYISKMFNVNSGYHQTRIAPAVVGSDHGLRWSAMWPMLASAFRGWSQIQHTTSSPHSVWWHHTGPGPGSYGRPDLCAMCSIQTSACCTFFDALSTLTT